MAVSFGIPDKSADYLTFLIERAPEYLVYAVSGKDMFSRTNAACFVVQRS